MRLRYLHIRHYPPLEDVALVFNKQTLLPDRKCAIRFVVGVNGSGKTHLLQALAETFLALARRQAPHFPVTLVYELGEGKRNRLLVFQGQGSGRDAQWWQSTRPVESCWPDARNETWDVDSWRSFVETIPKDDKNWEALIRGGNWPGAGVGLPRTVLAYTTGCLAPWQTLFHTEPDAGDVDIVSQGEGYDISQERPPGWSLRQELEHLARRADEGGVEQAARLKQLSEQAGMRERAQDICHLLDPVLLKFALLAVSLPEAMALFHQVDVEAEQQEVLSFVRDHPETCSGLRRLFSQVAWAWPVSVVFQLAFEPDEWGQKEAAQHTVHLQKLYGAASEVIRAPEPSNERRLFFDLRAPAGESADSDADFEFVGDALLNFLGGTEAAAFERFKILLELHRSGLLTDIQIAVRKADIPDILLFDELSDGEQVYLGRMALFHLLAGEQDALLLLDEPEVHFNDKWKREIVDIIDEALRGRSNDVLIATHSSITLTDVFNDEIILFRKRDGQAEPVEIRSTTFGADPSEVMIRLFGVPDSMGARALEWLDSQLDRDWKPDDLAELEKLLKAVGPGFHRSELRGIVRRLKDNAAQD